MQGSKKREKNKRREIAKEGNKGNKLKKGTIKEVEGRTDRRKDRRKEGQTEGNKEERKPGRKVTKKEGRK